MGTSSALVVLVLAAVVEGDDAAADVTREELEDLYDDLDAFWLLFSAALVFFMQAGFTMLEVGTCAS